MHHVTCEISTVWNRSRPVINSSRLITTKWIQIYCTHVASSIRHLGFIRRIIPVLKKIFTDDFGPINRCSRCSRCSRCNMMAPTGTLDSDWGVHHVHKDIQRLDTTDTLDDLVADIQDTGVVVAAVVDTDCHSAARLGGRSAPALHRVPGTQCYKQVHALDPGGYRPRPHRSCGPHWAPISAAESGRPCHSLAELPRAFPSAPCPPSCESTLRTRPAQGGRPCLGG